MKTVRDACALQPNALSIKLSDQVEQLDELIGDEGDGASFFDRTAITQGMRDLITEGIARLAGVSNQAIFHLKQAMGGGKTHVLVGFGLLARNPELRKTYCGDTLYAQSFIAAKTAAFNGRNNPPHFVPIRQDAPPISSSYAWNPSLGVTLEYTNGKRYYVGLRDGRITRLAPVDTPAEIPASHTARPDLPILTALA
jgi:hypothetical protein